MLRIFERLFRIDGWLAETNGARRSRAQVRRQQSGTQYGADIVIRFKGAAISASSTIWLTRLCYAARPDAVRFPAVALT